VPGMTACRHCKQEIVPCPTPSLTPCCAGWKHAEFIDSMPIGAHYCEGRSVNPSAEPTDLDSFAQYGSEEE
jgi:hypothetical protein